MSTDNPSDSGRSQPPDAAISTSTTGADSGEDVTPSNATAAVFDDDYTPYADYYRLAYDLAAKGLDQQQQTLDGVRDRASTLLAASALVTGFLGGAAFSASSGRITLGVPGWLAILLFAITLALLLNIVRPRAGWGFLPSGRGVINSYLTRQPTASLAQTHYGLAVEMDDAQTANRRKLNSMLDNLEAAIIFTGLSVVAWIVELPQ